ncbi:hypothetical protein GCM10008927_10460 [Amylibacter ulvae]|uniref:3-deoxy-D-manno-octulosonic acid transferase n=2 Tax=Paramylibacter ulvae TaxID=1651968 RepID=A0ABQ3D219_9RHOB|nr:hypothetical protein GCM10008927_10460 [Amylibacter ulvae]
MEAEIWPMMIDRSRHFKVPLFLCNAQYSDHKSGRAPDQFLAKICTGYVGIFAKSKPQADRFRHIGCTHIAITGETRFDQNVPQNLLDSVILVREKLAPMSRKIVTIASAVEGEESENLALIDEIRNTAISRGETAPLIIYVPRATERFVPITQILNDKFTVQNRSVLFDDNLCIVGTVEPNLDILVGDSFGEMYFYLGLSDAVVVGGGFDRRGAHNIIEPIAVQKPVFVGPYTWSIEYPAKEALDAGVLKQADTPALLAVDVVDGLFGCDDINVRWKALLDFYRAHTGSAQKVIDCLPRLLRETGFAKIVDDARLSETP